jgi:hypothetical protein
MFEEENKEGTKEKWEHVVKKARVFRFVAPLLLQMVALEVPSLVVVRGIFPRSTVGLLLFIIPFQSGFYGGGMRKIFLRPSAF